MSLRALGGMTALALLAGCSALGGSDEAAKGPPDLERAAIERGLVRDPGDSDVTGLYARDNDRVCVVKRGNGYRIGAYAEFGEALNCSGKGTLARSGSTLSIKLESKSGQDCAFDAKFDGERIVFPVNLPDACRALCGPRASFGATEVERLSESAAEAAAMRTPAGARLCSD